MRELFVWYRVADRRADEARAAVQAMQRSLALACPGLEPRLLVRRGADVQTWMETYARAPAAASAGIDAATERAIAAAALSLGGVIEGERHVEAFEVVARS